MEGGPYPSLYIRVHERGSALSAFLSKASSGKTTNVLLDLEKAYGPGCTNSRRNHGKTASVGL